MTTSAAAYRFPHARPISAPHKTLVMGIVNITPDSFSGRNAAASPEAAVDLALRLAGDGADIIDFGAESSRPHATALTADEEIARLGDAVRRLRAESGVVISVDTYHPETAAVVMEQGADIINDITALRGGWGRADRHNTEMAAVAAASGAHVVLMHMPSGPETGLVDEGYRDVVAEVRDFLRERIELAERSGIARERIWLDPGYGFSKDFESNRQLLLGLPSILDLGYGVLCGFSRKRMVGDALGLPADERLEGSLALAVMAAMFGAQMIRVHDVKETARALRMVDAVRHGLAGVTPPPDAIAIEPAEADDLPAILALQRRAYQSEAELVGNPRIPPLLETLNELQRALRDGVFLKAVDWTGAIIGSVRGIVKDGTLHVGKLMVEPSWQGRGIGSRLLAAIEEHCPQPRYELFTSNKSVRNIALYERAGYVRCGERDVGAGLRFVYLEKVIKT